jgi:hypothetical protein
MNSDTRVTPAPDALARLFTMLLPRVPRLRKTRRELEGLLRRDSVTLPAGDGTLTPKPRVGGRMSRANRWEDS